MTDDVVAELDAELALIEELPYRVPIHHLARRARNEIVTLRALHEKREVSAKMALADLTQLKDIVEHMPSKIRSETLEEAARVCDDMARSNAAYTWPATAIRALKERSDE